LCRFGVKNARGVSFSGENIGGCGENIGGCGEKVENSGEKCKFAGEKKMYHVHQSYLTYRWNSMIRVVELRVHRATWDLAGNTATLQGVCKWRLDWSNARSQMMKNFCWLSVDGLKFVYSMTG
jgi:hypothetical protein